MRRLDLAVAIVPPVFSEGLWSSPWPWWPQAAVFVMAACSWPMLWQAGRVLRGRRSRAAPCEESRAAIIAVQRARIAGELHEVVAHSVSVMTLAVGAARVIVDRDPARAKATMRVAEETGRQAIADLQRMVSPPHPHGGLEAAQADPGTREPQPRLTDLPRLLDGTREDGLAVRFSEDGTPPPLSPMFELSAYRIVQEALANAVRHGGAGAADVTLRWRSGALDLLVRDDGRPAPGEVVPRGGLLGMRERVRLFGGTLTAGAGPDGGFEVRARLPIRRDARRRG
ncbi:sensor histidine kinase [Spongiactinospora sp. TRM90649]|uniref:sensor histidine kinase n=1 Tax=Spongiactinospora sp. TRM90649 TaxID=3031114 RepID=UPI0023F62209|nr:sensor histidine kinase [Spongiactinospora sp. TRM90649]MDF5758492.1 sensor histidine kinase [Spongiactinospora sp. TRM90649]